MLGKLTKFEFKATARIFVPLYLAVCVTLLFAKGFMLLNDSKIWEQVTNNTVIAASEVMLVLTFFLYGVSIAVAIFLTLFIVLQRFYKNLFGDEGYLMHTLPVSAKSHILSKLIVASVWTLASIIVIWLAISLYADGVGFLKDCAEFFTEMPERAADHKAKTGGNYYIDSIIMTVYSLLFIPLLILGLYFSIALGGIILPKHKIGGSFIGFVVVSVMAQVYISILLMLDNSIANSGTDIFDKYRFLADLTIILIVLIPGSIFFFPTSHIMTKKLNIE